MKRLLLLALAFALTGCGALAPGSATPAPSTTPRIMIQTVVVTVVVTQLVTETPSNTPTPTLTAIPTFTPQGTALTGTGTAPTATGATPQPSGTASATGPTATLPVDAGGSLFTNPTRSSDHFALRCQPDTITFGISVTNPDVTEVDLFYRMEDQLSSTITGWIDIGKMSPDGSGNFTMDFPASKIDPDLRGQKSWLDYQFVGLNKVGQILGRSAKIVKQITFTLDCTG